MTLDTIKSVYFIGIGGIGMSALARFFHHEGKVVAGSDRDRGLVTDGLEALGITISYEQSAATLMAQPEVGMVVYTEAMAHDHPEMVAAKALGVPMMNYFDALGLVANEYYLIAVAGTHGKTTTTAMLTDILEEAGLDPTAIIGSLRSKTKSNFRSGKSKYAVVEACEYRRDFLSLQPDVLIITNIEFEHVDYYHDLTDVQQAFRELALRVPADGAIVANLGDAAVLPVVAGVAATVIDYRPQIDVSLKLRQPGLHNRLNAAAAQTAAAFVGVAPATATAALEWFAGTWRRFEYKGEVNGAPVYDDYGHHPTELQATFAGVRELYPQRRFKVVFQPHTYSRTAALLADFVAALAGVDEVYLLPIYAAREENTTGITSEALATAVMTAGGQAVVYQTAAAAALAVRESLRYDEPAVVLVIGAGPVTTVATLLTS